MSRILVSGGTVLPQDAQTGILASGDVLIEGDRIAGIAAGIEPGEDDRVVDAAGKFVLPGFPLEELGDGGLLPIAEGRSTRVKTLVDPWAASSRPLPA
jgi:hypothetical protein